MSLTGIGCEVRTRGGSFLGKKVSVKFWASEPQSDFSEPWGSSRCSSGSDSASCGGLNSKVAIMLTEFPDPGPSFWPHLLTDEQPDPQVAYPAILARELLAIVPC